MSRKLPRFLKLTLQIMASIAVLGSLSAAPAAAQGWAINKDKSRITFEIDAGGQPVIGEFQQFEAEIRFDPEHLDITEISAAIDINTISTGQSETDNALRSKEWFDAQTFPAVGLKVQSVNPGAADRQFVLEGQLIVKGRMQPITLPFNLAIDLGEATVTGETVVDRQKFGVGPGSSAPGTPIGDQVRVKFDISATRLDN